VVETIDSEGSTMRARFRNLDIHLLVAALALPVAAGACYHHGYDGDHSRAEHRWNDSEEPYYERWEHETHRDHRDFNQRGNDDQSAYWSWRVTIH
jgi:hypothetical protein